MSSAANRGKWAEGEVKKYLKKLEATACTSYRCPDARSGSLVTAPADFLICRNGVLTLLEVKEVEHETRLPHKNFALDQVARMRMWKASGARALVAVCFQPSRTWRILDIEYFTNRDDGASWNMKNILTVPLVTLETLL